MTMDYKAMWEELKRSTQEERDFFNSTRTILTDNSVEQAQAVLTDIVRFQCLDSVLDIMNDIEIDYMIEENSNE